jgi:hypothetical protein
MESLRQGIVHLDHEGRAIPLRFTWERIDRLGHGGVSDLIAAADSGQPGSLSALATLLEVASGQELSATALLANPPPFHLAFVAVLEAWALALNGPTKTPRKASDDRPMNRLRTWWNTLCRRLSQ